MGLRTWLGLRKNKKMARSSAAVVLHQAEPIYPRGDEYWSGRAGLRYYQVVREVCSRVAPHAQSIIDVGSNSCPQLEWFPDAQRRVSLDLEAPYRAPNIESIVCDFLEYSPEVKFDLVLCLQVLEHIDDPAPFARHLLEVGRDVVISVPYLWPEGACHWHCQDPVDEAKVFGWFGREPDALHIVEEAKASRFSKRLVCHYKVA